MRFSRFWFWGIFLMIIFLLIWMSYTLSSVKINKPSPTPMKTEPITTEQKNIVGDEKQKINDWIIKENLNQYGDSKDTVYTGGTPLFNETTGETVDKYEYIIKNHPDKPWGKD